MSININLYYIWWCQVHQLTSGLASRGSHLSLLPSPSAIASIPDKISRWAEGNSRVRRSSWSATCAISMRKMALLRRISTRFCYGYPVVLLEKHPKSASLSLPHLRLRLSTNVKRRQSSSFPLQTNPVPTLLTARLYSSPADRDGTSKKLTFEEYRKLRKSLKLRGRVAGLPMAFLGMGISSVINVHFNPNMFNQTPEEVELIL